MYVCVSVRKESVLMYREKNGFKIKYFLLLTTPFFHSNTAEGIQHVSIMTSLVRDH